MEVKEGAILRYVGKAVGRTSVETGLGDLYFYST